MSDPWFRPKTHGYGASPATWKGWAATLGFCALQVVFALACIVWPAASGTGPGALSLVLWLVLTVGSTVGFIRLSRAKTDGEWKWRWGDRRGHG